MSVSGVGVGIPLARSFQPPAFSTLDADSSGGISLEELQAAGPEASSSGGSERAQKLFQAMDSDQNGSISQDEKTAFDQQMQSQRSSLQFAAQQFGSNGSDGAQGAQGRPPGPPPGPPPAGDNGTTASDSDQSTSFVTDALATASAAYSSAVSNDQFSILNGIFETAA